MGQTFIGLLTEPLPVQESQCGVLNTSDIIQVNPITAEYYSSTIMTTDTDNSSLRLPYGNFSEEEFYPVQETG